jgi:hypothetical protein
LCGFVSHTRNSHEFRRPAAKAEASFAESCVDLANLVWRKKGQTSFPRRTWCFYETPLKKRVSFFKKPTKKLELQKGAV